MAKPSSMPYHGETVQGFRGAPGDECMKCLIVYYANGEWFGEAVGWKRSGSGWYRETSRIEIPQSKAAIEKFAAENRYVIEWRGLIPAASTQEAVVA